MDEVERAEIRECIDLLMGDQTGFHEAIGRLCRLVGMRYPAWEQRDEGESVEFREILADHPNEEGEDDGE